MGKIGYGYGSEWHLLRYMGRHRNRLQKQILSTTGGEKINWLDFGFSTKSEPLEHDTELKGVEFLRDPVVKRKWKGTWPQTGNIPNWDAVGQLVNKNKQEWLLVEAKANFGELRSKCDAELEGNSRKMIVDAMNQAKGSYNVENTSVDNWLVPYYQFCNRLTMLHFLNEHNVESRLLFIYFYGDKHKEKLKKCPQSAKEWEPELELMYQRTGIDKKSNLWKRVHTIFISTNPVVI